MRKTIVSFALVFAVTIAQAQMCQINVMAPPYSAYGDCSHDDHAAIMAAQTAAVALGAGNTTPACIWFPKPPGGCYLTSPLAWVGVGLVGQPSSIHDNYGGATIKGKAAQDILYVPDPSLNASNGYNGSWVIQDINFILDDSSAGSFPHRWPGRSVDDMTATAGSAVISSPRAYIGCGDIGQAIQINGAGAAGANLVTTIASVYPCWTTASENNPSLGNSWQQVKIATNASTTVSNAHAYISIAGLPVTANIGAAAIAMDDKDANTANWPTPLSGTGGTYPVLRNVNFSTTSRTVGGQNNTAAIFTQGQAGLYGLRADHVNMQRFTFGIVQGCSELNSYYGSCANDYQSWQQMNLNGITYPIIEYNGLVNHYSDIQLYTYNGPQFLTLANQYYDTFGGATFENSGMEIWGTGGPVGWRINGSGITFSNVGGQLPTYLDTDGAIGNFGWGSALYINGNGNRIRGSGGAVTDGGRNNQIMTTFANGSTPFNQSINTDASPIPTRGPFVGGRYSPDFLIDGNTSPYNLYDLFLWPKDFIFQGYGAPYGAYYADDSTSPTGGFLSINNSTAGLNQFSQFFVNGNANGYITPGLNIAIGPATASFMAKCASAGSAEIDIQGSVSGNLIQIPFSCTTNWAVYTAHGTISSQGTGGYLAVRNPNSTSVYLAWVYLRPDPMVDGFNVITASSGTQTAGQLACIKSIGPPVRIGTCSGTINTTTGACTGTCN